MPGEFKVDFGRLEAGASTISARVRAMETRLQELDSQLAPLRSDWTGDASEGYQQAKAKWTQEIDDMNALLAKMGRAVATSNHGYQEAEKGNAGLWGG